MLRFASRFLLTFSCACASLLAQTSLPSARVLTPAQTAAIHNYVTAEMKRQRIPGLAVGIYDRGRILLAQGYGLANVELSVPVKPETIFQSGSTGKQFVSAAIMMLVEEGKLSLDDSITKYFPDAPDTWKPIQIKNLLSHTSGLAEYESAERTGPKGPFYLRLDFTEDELVTKIEALPIEFLVGEKWNYRNTNYVLLGVIIHKITGKFYADYLQERIFKPLGMNSTRLISDADIIPNRPSGYEIVRNELKNQSWVSPTFNSTADGALYFNVLDIAKWDGALYGTKLLTQSSLDRIWTVYPLNNGKPNPSNYGFGWEINKIKGHKVIQHGGAWQGFTCDISRYTDDNLTVVILTNLSSANSRPGQIGRVVAGILIPDLMPAKLVAMEDKQPELLASLKTLLNQLATGQDVIGQMTPELAARITPESSKTIQSRLAAVLPPDSAVLVSRDKLPDGRLRSQYRFSKKGQSLLITYGLDKDGKVSLLGFSPDQEYKFQ
jgi:CubicO group peptidase (beta-lactamase class C family)